MENCKAMDTPLATNWRKESAFSREVVDVENPVDSQAHAMY